MFQIRHSNNALGTLDMLLSHICEHYPGAIEIYTKADPIARNILSIGSCLPVLENSYIMAEIESYLQNLKGSSTAGDSGREQSHQADENFTRNKRRKL